MQIVFTIKEHVMSRQADKETDRQSA